MDNIGKTAAMGGGGQTVVSPVLKVDDIGGPTVMVGVMGTIGHYYEVGGGHPCGVTTSDLIEVGKASVRWGMGDTVG